MKHTLIKMFASLVLLFGIMLGIVGVFSGCTTAHKASRYMVKHPVVGATYCTVYHPCKDSVSLITKYMEGELRIDTIDNSHTDSFTTIRDKVVTKYVVRYKTITQIKTDTVTSIRTIYQTDKACVELLRNAKEQIISKNKAINKRNTWVLGLSLSWLLLILILLVRALVIKRLNRG
jgi:endoglucanase Acf2